jgi:hypothetical protein
MKLHGWQQSKARNAWKTSCAQYKCAITNKQRSAQYNTVPLSSGLPYTIFPSPLFKQLSVHLICKRRHQRHTTQYTIGLSLQAKTRGEEEPRTRKLEHESTVVVSPTAPVTHEGHALGGRTRVRKVKRRVARCKKWPCKPVVGNDGVIHRSHCRTVTLRDCSHVCLREPHVLDAVEVFLRRTPCLPHVALTVRWWRPRRHF